MTFFLPTFTCFCALAVPIQAGARETSQGKSAVAPAFKFATEKGEKGKPRFLLNGRPFFPVANWIGFGVAVESLRRFKSDGFNTVILSADAGHLTEPHFRELMLACRELDLPVILDYGPGEFFRWVCQRSALCMKLPNGTAVAYPDFANPATRRPLNSVWRPSSPPSSHIEAIRSWRSPRWIPMISCIYRMVRNIMRSRLRQIPGVQTLPYGDNALSQYRLYLQKQLGLAPISVGSIGWEDVVVPRSRNEAHNELHSAQLDSLPTLLYGRFSPVACGLRTRRPVCRWL